MKSIVRGLQVNSRLKEGYNLPVEKRKDARLPSYMPMEIETLLSMEKEMDLEKDKHFAG